MTTKIFRRQSGSIPELEFNAAIACIAEVFSEQWLQSKSSKRNLLKDIWQRKDFVSSMELFFLGSALRKVTNNVGYEDWIEDFVRKVKSGDDGNAIGAIYEIVMYSMLADNPGVTLAPPAQAGYDFTARVGEGVIRYSCKRLQVSDEEKKSRIEFDRFKSTFKTILQTHRRTGWHAILHGAESSPLPKPHAIEKAVLAAFQSEALQTQVGAFRLYLKQLGPILEKSSLSLNKLSFAATVIRPIPKSEQNRFEDLFRRAAKNLTKHSPTPNENQINALMIGLPESISIAKAKKWVDERFQKSDSSRIAMVILTKFLPVKDVKKNTTLNSLQVDSCFNSNYDSASVAFIQRNAKEALKFAVPIGSVSQQSADLHLSADGAMFPIEDAYVHQSSVIHHEMKGEMPFQVNFSVPQDTQVTVTFVTDEGVFALEPITPQEFRYIIM